jgi:hypothetical protein
MEPIDSLGLGIQNCRERLRLIFGPEATLELTERTRLVEAVILIPPHRLAIS